MSEQKRASYVEEFKQLLQAEGLRDVSRWTLPNGDQPFDEDVTLAHFEDEVDGLFDLMSEAIEEISGQSHNQKR
ncbi:hypothetical protein [Azospirillum sp. sgz301742]